MIFKNVSLPDILKHCLSSRESITNTDMLEPNNANDNFNAGDKDRVDKYFSLASHQVK